MLCPAQVRLGCPVWLNLDTLRGMPSPTRRMPRLLPTACAALLAWAGLDRPQAADYAALREATIEHSGDMVEAHLDTGTLGQLLGLAPSR
jgi:hypothetical protein